MPTSPVSAGTVLPPSRPRRKNSTDLLDDEDSPCRRDVSPPQDDAAGEPAVEATVAHRMPTSRDVSPETPPPLVLTGSGTQHQPQQPPHAPGAFVFPTLGPGHTRSSRRAVSRVKSHRSRYLPTYKVVLLGDPAVGKSNLLLRFADNAFDPMSRATIGMEFVAREVDLSCAADTPAGNFSVTSDALLAPSPSHSSAASHSPSGSQRHSPPRLGEHSLSLLDASTTSDGRGTAAEDGAVATHEGLAAHDKSEVSASSCGGVCGFGGHVLLQLWDTAGQETNAALSALYYRGARGVAVVYDVTRRHTLHNVGRWVASARRFCEPECVIVVIGNKMDLRHSVEVSEDEARAFCHSLGCRHFLASAMNGEGVEHAFLQLLLAVHAEALARGIANDLPNGVEEVRKVGGTHGVLTAVDGSSGGSHIAGFRLRRPQEQRKTKGPACCSKR